MKLNMFSMGLVVGFGLGLSGAAQANDEPPLVSEAELFAGLIVGEPLPDVELSEISGRGGFSGTVVIDGGSFAELDNSDITSNQLANISNNSGITTPIQFVGDNNTVQVDIVLNIQLGTVQITNPVGSTITATPVVSIGAFETGIGR